MVGLTFRICLDVDEAVAQSLGMDGVLHEGPPPHELTVACRMDGSRLEAMGDVLLQTHFLTNGHNFFLFCWVRKMDDFLQAERKTKKNIKLLLLNWTST